MQCQSIFWNISTNQVFEKSTRALEVPFLNISHSYSMVQTKLPHGLLVYLKTSNISRYTRFRTLLSLGLTSMCRPFQCSFSWTLLIFCWLSTFMWSRKQICLVVKHASWNVVDILCNHLGCYESGFIKLCSLDFSRKYIYKWRGGMLDDYSNFEM